MPKYIYTSHRIMTGCKRLPPKGIPMFPAPKQVQVTKIVIMGATAIPHIMTYYYDLNNLVYDQKMLRY